MNNEKYHLKAGTEFTRFEFISEGAKGTVRKIIEFQKMNSKNVYNLAFGDYNSETDQIDDLVVTNNGDTEKVLSTVASAVYAFLDVYPNAYVYATGSTKARNRLYRMGITRYLLEMKEDFFLYGQVNEDFYEFEIGEDYDGFLVIRKK